MCWARRILPHRAGSWRDSSVGAGVPPRHRGRGGASLRVTLVAAAWDTRLKPRLGGARASWRAGLMAFLAADSSAHGEGGGIGDPFDANITRGHRPHRYGPVRRAGPTSVD